MPAPPVPKKKIPQVPPGGHKPHPAADGTHAAPPPPPPAKRPADTSQQAPNDGAEQADPKNPNAPSGNEAEAAGPGNNTTNPNEDEGEAAAPAKPVDTEPLRFIIHDEPGQEAHSAAANGTEGLHALMIGVQALRDQAPPEMWESVNHAANHLGDAYRQANFGQHEGAVASIGHAAGALERAGQATSDTGTQDRVGQAYDTAVSVGNAMRATNVNTGRPPWNPLPVKTRKGLPFTTVEGKRAPFPFRAGGGGDRERDDHGRFAPSGGGSDATSGTCKTCGAGIHRGGYTGQWVDKTGSPGQGHPHQPKG